MVDRWIHEQTGPPATLLPSGRRRWRWGDVEAWLRQRREGGWPGLHLGYMPVRNAETR
jgi:hypothetical protein